MHPNSVLSLSALSEFVTTCRQQKWTDDQIVNQLLLFASGNRGPELSDNCAVLIDGSITDANVFPFAGVPLRQSA
jgi:hypothetical protein